MTKKTDKQRLFEVMHKVAGMPILKEYPKNQKQEVDFYTYPLYYMQDHNYNTRDGSKVIALTNPKTPKISDVLNPEFLDKQGLQEYSNVINFILKGKGNYWVDVGSKYPFDILNDSQFKKITTANLTDYSLVKELDKCLFLFKNIGKSDDLGLVDFDFYQKILYFYIDLKT